jgi:hypothetical protein
MTAPTKQFRVSWTFKTWDEVDQARRVDSRASGYYAGDTPDEAVKNMRAHESDQVSEIVRVDSVAPVQF